MESRVEATHRQTFQPEILTRKQPDYSSEKDDTLLFYMGCRDGDLSVAEEACAEFYRRHYGFIMAFCRDRRWETEEHPVEEFVDAIFQKAWKYGARFNCDSLLNSDQTRRKVRAWLLTISKHTFIDILRGEPDGENIPLDDAVHNAGTDKEIVPPLLMVQESAPEIPRVNPRRKTLVGEFLEKTDLRTKAILIAIGDHWSPSSKQSEFPKEVTEALCKEFSIGKDSLRTYRRRALEALKNHINQNETNS